MYIHTLRRARRITVFSDSQKALKQLQGSKSNMQAKH